MSWSLEIKTTTDKAAGDLSRVTLSDDGVMRPDEASEQLEAARRAAKRLVESGCVGEGDITVFLSGHANGGNTDPGRKQPESAGDRVTVSIVRTGGEDG